MREIIRACFFPVLSASGSGGAMSLVPIFRISRQRLTHRDTLTVEADRALLMRGGSTGPRSGKKLASHRLLGA